MENRIGNINSNEFIAKKAEKITAAVYLMTNFFDSRESLKWQLRKTSLSFLSFVSNVFYKNNVGDDATKDNPRELVEEVITLLTLARNVSLISPMNFSILREEYMFLSGSIAVEMKNRGFLNDFEFPEKFFTTSREAQNKISGIKDTNDTRSKEPVKDTSVIGVNKHNDSNVFKAEEALKYKKDIRRETILKMLRAKGQITIKDISSLMQEVSEKTLQRELLAMVAEGLLVKEGERRWSKYLLKT